MTTIARYQRFAIPHLVCLFLLATGNDPSRAADLEKFTPHHVARIRTITWVAISPDGSKIAYLLSVPRRPSVDEDGPGWLEMHVVGPDGKSRPFVTGEVNVADPTWTRDGKAILFLAKRGNDEHRSLYKIDAEGGEARRVLTFETDIIGFAIKADGRRVGFLATEPEPKAKADQKINNGPTEG